MITVGEPPEHVLVIAKEPRPGRVKTRLQTRFSPVVAAELAHAALTDTLDAAVSTGLAVTVVLDGEAGPWLRPDVGVLAQRGDGLDERLAAAFDDSAAGGARGPVLLIGMDTPQVSAAQLAAVDFTGVDAVVGLAEDGGFWALGLRHPHPEALLGVPMSTATTGREQVRRLRSAGLRVGFLPSLRDVDTPADAEAVAALAPASRFAARHRRAVAELAADAAPADGPRRVPALDLFEEALEGALVVAEHPGAVLPLPARRWTDEADVVDHLLLTRCRGTVLDLGCGPGRLVAALTRDGVPALGVDVSARAVDLARRRGADVLHRDLHDPLPGEGRWGTVLLADGNVGIGGSPAQLLRRCAELLDDDGLLLVEADPDPDLDDVGHVVLRSDDGQRWARLPWARLGAEALLRYALPCGFTPLEHWEVGGRVLLVLRRGPRTAAVAS